MKTQTYSYTEKPAFDGIQRIYHFSNGYGASIVKHMHSYGGSEGKWELAVLHGMVIDYDTPITQDVIGYLDWEEVEQLLNYINALPPKY